MRKSVIYEGDDNKPSIMLLHGLGGSERGNEYYAKYFNKLGFKVYRFYARDFKDRHTNYYWDKTMKWYLKFLDKQKEDFIVMGISFGGTLSIGLSRSKHVKMVFAISALHDDKGFDAPTLLQDIISDWSGYDDYVKKHVYNALPVSYKLTKRQSEKIYLVHARMDTVVKYRHFLMNKKKFNIPKSRTLVFNQPGHGLTNRRKYIAEWMYNRIKRQGYS